MNKILAFSIMVFVFLVSCNLTTLNAAEGFSLGISFDKTSYVPGEEVKMIFTVTNNSDTYKELTFNTAQIYNYIVYKDGKQVYSWAAGRMFAQVVTKLRFSPSETKGFLEKWPIKDKTGKPLGDGVYMVEFTLVNSDGTGARLYARKEFVVGDVHFEPVFKDVKDFFVSRQLRSLYDKGIVKGYPDGTFGQERVLSRAEAVALVVRSVSGSQVSSYHKSSFNDVNASHWALTYIEYAVEQGWIKGTGPSTFEPNAPISRADFVVLVVRAFGFGSDEAVQISAFYDAPETHPAFKEITVAFQKGIVFGKEVKDGKLLFYPQDALKRGEAILILGRALETLD